MSFLSEIKYLNVSLLSTRLMSRFGRKSESIQSLDRYIFQVVEAAKKVKIKTNLFSPVLDITIDIQNNPTTLKIRKNSSDWEVFNQVFLEEEYSNPLKIIEDKLNLSAKRVLIDAGANIGCSSLYLLDKHHQSIVISLEPFPKTFDALSSNTVDFKSSIFPIQKALWSKNQKLAIDRSFRDGKEWSIQTIPSDQGPIEGVTIGHIMKEYEIETIDILKIDIEGSEYELFKNSTENSLPLDQIKSIIIEIHDDAGNRNEIYESLAKANFACIDLGELTLFLNNRYIKA